MLLYYIVYIVVLVVVFFCYFVSMSITPNVIRVSPRLIASRLSCLFIISNIIRVFLASKLSGVPDNAHALWGALKL